jgi:hypothetical protein
VAQELVVVLTIDVLVRVVPHVERAEAVLSEIDAAQAQIERDRPAGIRVLQAASVGLEVLLPARRAVRRGSAFEM